MKQLIALAALLFTLSCAAQTQEDTQAPPPPVVYEGLEFPDLPYPSNFVDVNGTEIHYLEAGDPDADPILLLHGLPAWSYVWRDVMPHLEDSGRVIAMDFAGFGLSGDLDNYSVEQQIEVLTGFVEVLRLQNITLVVQDLGSVAGLAYAAENEDRLKNLVLLEAATPPLFPIDFDNLEQYGELGQVWGLLSTPGAAQEAVLNQNFFIEQLLPGFIVRTLSEGELNAYRAPFPTPESRRALLGSSPGQIALGGTPEDFNAPIERYITWLGTTELPTLMLYAAPGALGNEAAVAWVRENVSNAELEPIGEGIHFVQEDQPDVIGREIAAWLVRQAEGASPEPMVYEGLEFPGLPYPSSFVTLEPKGLPAAKMHYMEGGDPDADPILFIHGNPTWSYLWRDVMPHLENQGHVIALDLIGMGMSDKPDIDYFFFEHALYVEAFIEELGLENITFVIQDWGSGLGLDYAARNPEKVKGIALFEAIIPPLFPSPLAEASPELQEFFTNLRTPGLGEELAMNQNIFVEGVLPTPLGTAFGLSEDELNAYRVPFPTPESRFPVWRWPQELPWDDTPADVTARVNAYAAYLQRTETPVLYLWGEPGALHTPETIPWLEQRVNNLSVTFIGTAGHFAQEDQPDALGAAISTWYQLTF